MRRPAPALVLLAALLFAAAPALGRDSGSAAPAQSQDPGQPAASPQAATAALGQTMQAIAKNNQATAAAAAQAEAQTRPAQSAPAQKTGSGKAIYGDIIIHK